MSPVTASLIGLILAVAVHIAVIARWSGRIDSYMQASEVRIQKAEAEIVRLREARHKADGILQRHEGLLGQLDRRGMYRSEFAEGES
jgi:hypothetical protein